MFYKKLKREIKIKNEYATLIRDLLFDYDGCNTVESLKELIDEVNDLLLCLITNDDKKSMYCSPNGNTNILGESLHEKVKEEL